MNASTTATHAWMGRATVLVAEVYATLMEHIVEQRVLHEREGSLGATQQTAIEQGRKIDARVPRLMAISGKGG